MNIIRVSDLSFLGHSQDKFLTAIEGKLVRNEAMRMGSEGHYEQIEKYMTPITRENLIKKVKKGDSFESSPYLKSEYFQLAGKPDKLIFHGFNKKKKNEATLYEMKTSMKPYGMFNDNKIQLAAYFLLIVNDSDLEKITEVKRVIFHRINKLDFNETFTEIDIPIEQIKKWSMYIPGLVKEAIRIKETRKTNPMRFDIDNGQWISIIAPYNNQT